MSKKDIFAQIASDTKSVSKEELVAFPPPPPVDARFHPSVSTARQKNQLTYEQQLEKFYQDLKALREKHLPFMKDYAPELPATRISKELNEFSFRYSTEKDEQRFSRVLNGDGEWEQVSIPDYRGPIGLWTGFYRTQFTIESPKSNERVFLKFLGVDYVSLVYLNGRCIGRHEGFFSPFEFDVTDIVLKDAVNTLVVEIHNDEPMIDGDGEKIYAATGLGWDDPELGWHHCPPGAGIYNKVIVETRPNLFIHDIYVRPLCDEGAAEAWIEIYNAEKGGRSAKLTLTIHSRNYQGYIQESDEIEISKMGPNVNFYRFRVEMNDYKTWSPSEPWLYAFDAKLTIENGVQDVQRSLFGMRSFTCDESAEPKGTLRLNNEIIFLRGANDMGHMQQCVVREDWDQLIDDILIAKLANMNYYRFTQRPVQKEIYHYCDMLGMLNQTDLPLFGWLRRTQVAEAIKQAGEMERLIRSHPSSIMVSYINEPFSAKTDNKGHRHLYRDELENFFQSASNMVRMWNPDRVIKHCEGDYDPPTSEGLSDFHCYTMWYTNHALPICNLHNNELPKLKQGWKSGCGEYGAEGLDPLDVMLEMYPKDWTPANLDDEWRPEEIKDAQTYSMHGDWFELQHTITGWINESQAHQALATRLMTDAFRRRSDVIVSTAVHLLIDAWPSGWMKSLVDCRRKPKPSYFELQRSYEPLRAHPKTDQFNLYGGSDMKVEIWALNDTTASYPNAKCLTTIRCENQIIHQYESEVNIPASSATCYGKMTFAVPVVEACKTIWIDMELISQEGKSLHCDSLSVVAHPKETVSFTATCLDEYATKFAELLGLIPVGDAFSDSNPVIVASEEAVENYKQALSERLASGGRVIFLDCGYSLCRSTNENPVQPIGLHQIFFLARNAEHPTTSRFGAKDFYMPYNAELDRMDALTVKHIVNAEGTPLLFTYGKPAFNVCQSGSKPIMPVVLEQTTDKGKALYSAMNVKGIIGSNPAIDKLFISWLAQ